MMVYSDNLGVIIDEIAQIIIFLIRRQRIASQSSAVCLSLPASQEYYRILKNTLFRAISCPPGKSDLKSIRLFLHCRREQEVDVMPTMRGRLMRYR